MAVTPQSFRQAFPEFANPDVYRDLLINSWVALAVTFLDPNRWGAVLDYGTMLYTAHRLALGERNRQTALAGGVPGQTTGPVSSKSVDKVAQSFDTGAVTLDGEGQWNLTTYGIEFSQLAAQFGMGGMQVMGCGVPGGISWGGGSWGW